LTKIATLSGFFTYGEFFHHGDKSTYHNQLLNQTMTILTLSEDRSKIIPKSDLTFFINKGNIQTIEALSHLVNQTSTELQVLNSKLEIKIKESVEKNRQKDQQMLHQAKLAQMGEMISMIAHQWRQPLNAITLTTSNLKFKSTIDDFNSQLFKEELERIEDYAQHLSKTIDDFRTFFKDNKTKEKTTFKQLVDSTLEIIKVAIENKNIKIITNFKNDNEFETYPNELKQVILNIIKNAEDIILEKEIKDGKIEINTDDNILTIKDNAGGIPEDIIDKIFDPYFSTKKEKDGTGLGLYMSKTIIEEHCGGKLSVSNDEDGAVFKIEFTKEGQL